MAYLGKTPSQATRKRYYKTASGSETSISGTMTVGGTLTFTDGEFVDVSVNGVALVAGTDYNTTTANTIGGLSALSANDQVEIVVYDTFSVFGGNVNADFTVSNGTLTAGTVDINGGAVDGTTIGAASASTGAFTTISAGGVVTANAGVVVDNITIDGTEIDLSSGDLTLDVANDIILDADGGNWRFKDAGTSVLTISRDSNTSVNFFSAISDADIKFMGNDGGSTITALTLDMSLAGTAIFNHDIEMPDSGLLRMGAGGDLILTSDGTNGTIFTNNGNLTADAAGELIIDVDLQGEGNGILLKDDGTLYGNIFRTSSDLVIMSSASDEDLIFKGNDGGSTITALTFDMSEAVFATFNAGATIPGIINVGSVGASGGTAGEIAFGGIGGSIDGFRIRNTQGNYLELSAVSSGNSAVLTNTGVFLVGKTSDSIANNGISLAGSATGGGFLSVTNDGNACATFNRKSSSGDIITFSEDGSKVGAIGSNSGQSYFFTANDAGCGIAYGSDNAFPSNGSGALSDNSKDLGGGATRWDDVFATNGTIQTSDENEKQDIASLTSAEITAAKAISKLFKTFKWKDKVATKGDAARTHTGVVAQQVQKAMSDAGLDATKYAFWCSNTWTNDDGNEQTRMGVRYPELLAFIGAATEQRLADIEARIAKLENA